VVRPWPIPVNELRAGGTGLPTVALERAALVAATAVRVRSPAAKPDGKMGCKTSGTGCGWRVQTTLRIPDAGSKKIRNHALGAGPRRPAPERCRRIPARQGALPGLERPGDVRRSDIDTAGFEPAVFAVHSGPVDIAAWRIFAAIAERPPGIRDCNIGLGGGWDEKASHIP
jgi:hypothetical protein